MKPTLTIDAVTDFVSPWCWLAHRRFGRALARLEGLPHVLRWAPFEINPDLPPQGMDVDEYLARLFGDREAARPFMAKLTDLGERDGIRFHFERVKSVPNTLDAHRLILHAEASGRHSALAERLFAGFFEEGADIGRTEVLAELAARAGMDEQASREFLASDQGREEVREREARIRATGLTGVPSFVLNGSVVVLGAQDAETFLSAVGQAVFPGLPEDPGKSLLH